jgi:hypothetical protein
MTLSITTLRIMTFSITSLINTTFSIIAELCYAVCLCAECHNNPIVLSVIMTNVIMLSVVVPLRIAKLCFHPLRDFSALSKICAGAYLSLGKALVLLRQGWKGSPRRKKYSSVVQKISNEEKRIETLTPGQPREGHSLCHRCGCQEPKP